MFTGIIEEIGKVSRIKKGPNSASIQINCKTVLENIQLGDSIAVNGVCLTATSFNSTGFEADVMHETLNRTNLGELIPGNSVNLERAMIANGRFGGHIVSGHIDGLGRIFNIEKDGIATWYTISTNSDILKYIIEKGSIAIDGISLTVAKTDAHYFKISIIPHTSYNTTLSEKKIGDNVNLENDPIGKYVEKLLITDTTHNHSTNITKEFLIENGF